MSDPIDAIGPILLFSGMVLAGVMSILTLIGREMLAMTVFKYAVIAAGIGMGLFGLLGVVVSVLVLTGVIDG